MYVIKRIKIVLTKMKKYNIYSKANELKILKEF